MTTGAQLLQALRDGDDAAFLALLADRPEGLETVDENGVSLLMLTLYHRRENLTEALLALGPELNLHESAALGDVRRVATLLDERPEWLEAESPDGFRALHLASFFGRSDVVRLLIERGADACAAAGGPSRVQPIHSAVAGRDPETLKVLIQADAHLDAKQAGGFTPLMGAAGSGLEEIARALLSAGADKSVRDDEGKTARDHALDKNQPTTAKLL